jgi:hypothetical protein
MHAHRGLDEVSPPRAGRDLQHHALEAHGVVTPDHTLLLVAQDLRQVDAADRHECAPRLGRVHGEASVVARHVLLGQEAVGRLNRRDPGVGQFVHQTALERAEHALAAPPRLRRVGRDVLDPELGQHPADLGERVLVHLGAGLRGVKVRAAPGGVERARQALGLEHLQQALEAAVGALLLDQKRQVDLRGGVVHRHDQIHRPPQPRQP